MKKRLLGLALVFATVFGLAGCGVEREGDVVKAFNKMDSMTNGKMVMEMTQADAEGNEVKMIMTEEIDGNKSKSSETMISGENEMSDVSYAYEKTEDDVKYMCYVAQNLEEKWEEECYEISDFEEDENPEEPETYPFFGVELSNDDFEYKKEKYHLKEEKKAEFIDFFLEEYFGKVADEDIEEASFVVVLADGNLESVNAKIVVKDMGSISLSMKLSKIGKVKITLPEIEPAA